MKVQPTRATAAGQIYLELRKLAQQQGRPTDEVHQIYGLECFLMRLALSPHADMLVLKGGVLLAAYDARRPPEMSTYRPIRSTTMSNPF